MAQAVLATKSDTETDIGHAAFIEIKNQINLIDTNLKTVLSAVPAAITDGLSPSLASDAEQYLNEIKLLSTQMRSLHLKAHAKFRAGIETAPNGSSFSARVPT